MKFSFQTSFIHTVALCCALVGAASSPVASVEKPTDKQIVIAEGESFQPRDTKGWKLTAQDLSYGSHTYGGMWVTHGAGLGAPAKSEGSVAVQTVQVPASGAYHLWSKYQSPPYFNYLHKIEVVQNSRTRYSHTFGKAGTDRLWSFSGESDELWWPWGVDHDAAEQAPKPIQLTAGLAEIRLITVPNAEPAGDRFVDFVVLTSHPAREYEGFKPYGVATPFAFEALAATKLYMRFRNTTAAPAQITVSRRGHFQPNYAGATGTFPEAPVIAGAWSEWFNIGPFCRLVHNEGLTFSLPDTKSIALQFSRDAGGREIIGDVVVVGGEAVNIPIDITWNKDSRVRASRELAGEVIALSKKWRTANGGKKPRQLVYYGDFRGQDEWIPDFKDALGYNSQLSDQYDHIIRDGRHAHVLGPEAIRKFAAELKDKDKFRVLSFGDEIRIGTIDYNDPAMQPKFVAWLKAKNFTKAELGIEPENAVLTKAGDARLTWYSTLFSEEQQFNYYRENTNVAKEAIGPHVVTGANYSPHHVALYYGPVYQWVDIFKQNGMSLFWAEDYIFSVPEVPQILSWQFAQMRSGTKYHNQPIHFYVMPHAPGQTPENLRRNMVFSVGAGAKHIDNFWVAPQENFTENFVSWGYNENFRVIHESIYDSGEVEQVAVNGRRRANRVAVVLSKATDFNESRLMVDKSLDPFTARSKNAPQSINQITGRKEQQMLYLALRQAQHGVDLVTEDDIVDGVLNDYDVVYFAGEWIDHRAVGKLDEWVKAGGVLYAAAGLGHLNEFGEYEPGMQQILGLKGSTIAKNLYIIRTLLELPQAPPIGTISLGDLKVSAIGMKQVLTPGTAKVLGTWEDGSAAVTVNGYGKGKAFAVGTLAGNSYMKTALRLVPWARGGFKSIYHPTDFDPAAISLVRLGVAAAAPQQQVVCSNNLVEAEVVDGDKSTLVTLTNWTNAQATRLKVNVKAPSLPGKVWQVGAQKELPVTFEDGVATFTADIAEADYVLMTWP